MKDRLGFSGEFKILKPSNYKETLNVNPLWYLPDSPVGKLLENAGFSGIDAKKPIDWSQVQWETFHLIHAARIKGELAIGTKEEFPANFNDDDDRWCPEDWDYKRNRGINRFTGKENISVQKDHSDLIVAHHTNTTPGYSLEFFNTLAMLRLYVPEFIKGFPTYDGKFHPLNSGHYSRDGKIQFHGYHCYIRQSGVMQRTLRQDETGFHAGSYPINTHATGIVLDGDFTDSMPTQNQISSLKLLINYLEPDNIIAHQEVKDKDGNRTSHNCPGGKWDIWKRKIGV